MQILAAADTAVGNMIENLVRVIDQAKGKPLRASPLARLRTTLATQRRRRRALLQAIQGRRLRRVLRVRDCLEFG